MAGSKIRLYGSTSGYVELAAPAVAPDGVLTLPATVGGFGKLVDVKHVLKTDTFSASVASGADVAVTDLSITHEVADASNKLIISAFFGAAASSAQRANVGIAVDDGTSLIAIGDVASNRTRVTAGGSISSATANFLVTMPSVTFVHTPGAGSKTYTVRAVNIEALTRTVYINRSEADTDVVGASRAASSLVIQEVAA